MDDNKEFNGINVIPFIDIMLVLLTIVLTTSTFVARGAIPLDLPKASPANSEISKNYVIDIDRRGNIFLDGRPIAEAGLQAALAACDAKLPLMVRADRELPLQAFVAVLDQVSKFGFSKVSLQTETEVSGDEASRARG